MERTYTQLSLEDRCEISSRHQAGQSIREIAASLIEATGGCALQEAADGSLWPCSTCTCALLKLFLSEAAPEYHEHNTPPDRINEVWRAILQLRDGEPVDTVQHERDA